MKRVFQLLIIFIITLSFSVVNAEYAYVWTVNGETLKRGGDAILNGSAKWIESDEYSGGVLILDNYNGGQIKIECKGTGINQVFAVELNGDNTINSDNIGLLTTDKVVFIGDGTLTVTAPIPVSSVDEIKVPNQKSQIIIYGKDNKNKEEVTLEEKEEVEEDLTTKEDESEEVVEPSKGINKYVYLVIIGIAVIGLFVLSGVVSNFNRKRS